MCNAQDDINNRKSMMLTALGARVVIWGADLSLEAKMKLALQEARPDLTEAQLDALVPAASDVAREHESDNRDYSYDY